MTVEKATYSRGQFKNKSSRKSMPSLTSKKPERSISAAPTRRATTDALDICFDYEPMRRDGSSDGSEDTVSTANDHGSADDLQQLVSAIHKRYKVSSERQEKEFKESLKQTIKKSVHEFQSHMDKFSVTMYQFAKLMRHYRDDRLSKLRHELNNIYLDRQKQLDKIYEEYEEFKLAMQESVQKVEEKDTSFRNAVAQYFEDSKNIKQEYKMDMKEIEDLVNKAAIVSKQLRGKK